MLNIKSIKNAKAVINVGMLIFIERNLRVYVKYAFAPSL
jgi:hypothetical protein